MTIDLRQLKTDRNIKEAMIKMLQKKNFEKITVSDICAIALTSRSTFYLHYLDKYDLIEKIVEEQKKFFEEIFSQRIKGFISGSFKKTISDFYNDLYNNKETIMTLFKIDKIEYNLKNIYKNIITEQLEKYFKEQKSGLPNDLLVSFGTSIIMDTLNWTLEHGLNTKVLNYAESIRYRMFDQIME
ncbi:TetR/AcrR family transcriptional regulator [Oenococcus alcoholitolerans]|uniref:TetR/AcrR family transcriptional regulator n=1 Tax=Oenococcus alcoholitolerans TaxID=931074 RepID=UPI003F6F8CB8